MRDAMCADGAAPTGLYFGTRDGTVFASNDGGDSWQTVAEHLPDVMCLKAVGALGPIRVRALARLRAWSISSPAAASSPMASRPPRREGCSAR